MDAIAHLLVGRLLAGTLGADQVALGWLATVFAILPDFDTVTWAFPRLRRYVQHRGLTHTLPFGLGASLLAGVLFALVGWAPFLTATGVAFAGFLSHVALDVLNWGAPVLWPWDRRRVEWTVHGGFAWSAGISASSIAVLALVETWAPSAATALALSMGAVFLAYLGLRSVLKWATVRKHPGRRVVPTGNPFVWRVV